MSKPCLDQDIKIKPHEGSVKIIFNGAEIASSEEALDLHEANYKPVIYIPLKDVNNVVLHPTEHSTHCPYKGDASYYDISMSGKTSKNAVWYYADPCPLVAKIGGYVAFWGDDIAYV